MVEDQKAFALSLVGKYYDDENTITDLKGKDV